MDKQKRPIPSSFTVSMYGDLLPTDNPMISKSRMALFYQGLNRNRSYFTEAIASRLIERAVGTPVVGVYDKEKQDFLQHAPVEEAQVYGHIPESHNFAWERRKDNDEVEREYACFDVHLYTGRYPEAASIVGKKQSMELDPNTIDGDWKVMGGQDVFVFDDAMLSGCCVLGDDYEPCFEGAGFFSLKDPGELADYLNTMREGVVNYLKEAHSTKETDELNIEGGTTQMKLNFGWAEDDARVAMFEHLNPNFTEEKGWLVDAAILAETAEGSYLTYNFANNVYEVYTVKTEEETGAISYEGTAVNFYTDNGEEHKVALEEANTKIEELNGQFAAQAAEMEAKAAEVAEATASYEARIGELEAKVAEYTARETEIEEARKVELINSYNTLLPEEELRNLTEEKANFTYDEIEAKLAVSYMREQRKETGKVPAGQFTKQNPEDGLVALLSRYKK